MAPRKRGKTARAEPESASGTEPGGMFQGMIVYMVSAGVQRRRLEVWKQKLLQMGAVIKSNLSNKITHMLALSLSKLLQEFDHEELRRFKGIVLSYEWLENCLKSGERLSEDPYRVDIESEMGDESDRSSDTVCSSPSAERLLIYELSPKQLKIPGETSPMADSKQKMDREKSPTENGSDSPTSSDVSISSGKDYLSSHAFEDKVSHVYNPPDLNRNITEKFGKLINIYRALGDDRRSFSYYKAIPVIEKLPFKIESGDQVKNLPAIGKSLRDHIHEIVTTGRLSKLEHFETDEKVRTVSLFGEVWGIGPATALKLYEKGYRTLEDLKGEESLTHGQRIGLRYFDDIKTRIPRHEVKEMEALLQKAGEAVLPAVIVVCGGSYRRGKATCGDMDIVVTHPDGKSHVGFLHRYVQYLKEINFLKEDLVFSINNLEENDSGVDTYFGLCTYPGRELHHRIDIKVYPRNLYAFGLIAWTGNDVLNRRLRLLAESKGYRLDDTGLFLSIQSSGGKRGAKSTIRCKTEKEVFDVLGFPWLEPHERNL